MYGKAPHNGLGSSFFSSSVLVTRVCGLQVTRKPGHPIQIIWPGPWLTLFCDLEGTQEERVAHFGRTKKDAHISTVSFVFGISVAFAFVI